MIRTLFVGMARSLFLLAAALAGLALLSGYCAFRLCRAAVAKDHGMPVRDSAFGVMMALVVLGKALQAQAAKQGRRPEPEEESESIPTIYIGGS